MPNGKFWNEEWNAQGESALFFALSPIDAISSTNNEGDFSPSMPSFGYRTVGEMPRDGTRCRWKLVSLIMQACGICVRMLVAGWIIQSAIKAAQAYLQTQQNAGGGLMN